MIFVNVHVENNFHPLVCAVSCVFELYSILYSAASRMKKISVCVKIWCFIETDLILKE
jgi:hypothetical protein